MYRLLAPVAVCLVLAACSPGGDADRPSRLQPGTWSGGLTPMNHPDMVTPLTYEVAYRSASLTLSLAGPGGAEMPARDVALHGDTLRFVFDEPDAGVPLTCALGRTETNGFEGRCTDPDGKWALFTMDPPAS